MGSEILRIKEVLEQKGISAARLAKEANISYSSLWMAINNRRLPRVVLLVDIAEHLNIDIRKLFKPSKAVGEVNGFLDYNGQPHIINNREDLDRFVTFLNNEG